MTRAKRERTTDRLESVADELEMLRLAADGARRLAWNPPEGIEGRRTFEAIEAVLSVVVGRMREMERLVREGTDCER